MSFLDMDERLLDIAGACRFSSTALWSTWKTFPESVEHHAGGRGAVSSEDDLGQDPVGTGPHPWFLVLVGRLRR